MQPRLLLFGIDGASYALFERWCRNGYLPNFADFLSGSKSVFCRLNCTIPPHTAPGWVSMMTGVNPGKHGIFQFWHTQDSQYGASVLNSRDWRAQPIWQILNSHGVSTGVVNVPMTHPPSCINGYHVAWPLTKTLHYSYPPELLSEIAKAGGHYLPDIAVMYDNSQDYLKKALDITRKRVETLKYLLTHRLTDVVMAVFPEVDRISHYYWQAGSSEPGDAVRDLYAAVDRGFGEILSFLPAETTVIVASDHGFGPGDKTFYAHNFLEEAGYLRFSSFTPAERQFSIDWRKTRAYMPTPGCYGININLKGRQRHGIVEPGREYENLRDELREAFSSVRIIGSGRQAFAGVANREEIYKGDCVNAAPDIVLIPAPYDFMVHPGLDFGSVWGPLNQTGLHNPEGVFMMRSPSISRQFGDTIAIEDIAPTILSDMDLPIPTYMDGNPLPVFNRQPRFVLEDTRKQSEDSETLTSLTERAEIEESLRKLGYLE